MHVCTEQYEDCTLYTCICACECSDLHSALALLCFDLGICELVGQLVSFPEMLVICELLQFVQLLPGALELRICLCAPPLGHTLLLLTAPQPLLQDVCLVVVARDQLRDLALCVTVAVQSFLVAQLKLLQETVFSLELVGAQLQLGQRVLQLPDLQQAGRQQLLGDQVQVFEGSIFNEALRAQIAGALLGV